MTYNFNGKLIEGDKLEIGIYNRGLNYGDGLFESMKFSFGRINFWEDHYFRLMSSMRILRMEIPMSFSPEYLEEQIRETLLANKLEKAAARIKMLITRKEGGKYTPASNEVDLMISVNPLDSPAYVLPSKGLTVDIFKDFHKQKSLLSNLKTTSAPLHILASVYRRENELDECFLLNDKKHLCEAISANVFLVKGEEIITPSLKSGCLKGVMRKNILEIIPQLGYTLTEDEEISPFELQRVDEVFLSNTIKGIEWVSSYRKKTYSTKVAQEVVQKLNVKAALN